MNRTTVGVLLAVAIIPCALRALGWFEAAELWAYDRLHASVPAEPRDDRIIIVGWDESDIDEYGVLSDRVLARILTKIAEAQPVVIGLNITRDELIEPGYNELATVLQNQSNLFGVGAIDQGIDAPPALPKERVTTSETIKDPDGNNRRNILWLDPSTKEEPNLGLAVAEFYLRERGVEIAKDESPIRIENTKVPRLNSHSGPYVGNHPGSYQIFVDYRRATFLALSAADILEGNRADELRDRVVIVGKIAASTGDRFTTPGSYRTESSAPQAITGTEIQAYLASNVLDAADGQPFIRSWPEPVENLWIFAIAIGTGVLCWRQRHEYLFLLRVGAIAVGSGIAVGAIAFVAFAAGGWWLPVVPVWVGVGTAAIATSFYSHYRWREEILAAAIHNLGNAVRIGANASAALATTELDPEQAESLAIASESFRRIEATIQLLISQHREQQIVPGNLNRWLLNIAASIQAARRIKVEIIKNLDPQLNKRIGLSKAWLVVIDSILTNAFDSLQKRQETASADFQAQIHLTTVLHPNGAIAVEIQDNGIGIPQRFLKRNRLFQPYQSSKGRARGLGLAAAYRASRSAGLEISVKSDGWSFALFVIYLPAHKARNHELD